MIPFSHAFCWNLFLLQFTFCNSEEEHSHCVRDGRVWTPGVQVGSADGRVRYFPWQNGTFHPTNDLDNPFQHVDVQPACLNTYPIRTGRCRLLLPKGSDNLVLLPPTEAKVSSTARWGRKQHRLSWTGISMDISTWWLVVPRAPYPFFVVKLEGWFFLKQIRAQLIVGWVYTIQNSSLPTLLLDSIVLSCLRKSTLFASSM